MSKRSFIAFVLGFALVVLPGVALANIVPCDGPNCRACDLVQLGQNALKFFIDAMALIIALVFAIGGLKMVLAGGNEGQVASAKSMMTNSVIGFILLLSSYLIIDTILKTFVTGADLGPWNEVKCESAPPVTPTGTTPPVTPAAGTYTDADARAALAAAGITVNKTEAQGTSLNGMRTKTVQDVIDLKHDCDCTIVITGGTESTGGHAEGTYSHESGYKYDMRVNDTLDGYIYSSFDKIKTRSDGAEQYRNPKDGTIYAREGDHWDVLVPPG